MSNSYKFYSDTKDIMKKYVNATEGAIIYGISKSRIMVLASEAGAVYKVGNSALINTDIFEMYLEKFKEPTRPLALQGLSWRDCSLVACLCCFIPSCGFYGTVSLI